ncbi:30S ribosomal protein S20 [Mobilitalea sibirica]|uniref:30S ribosomal protein S20 n=1 Tax=Mobilitalea sibirica TaxID=1462919 RepID=A0A8J7KVK3_9FIRM|nr:DUF2680 domain-containing protein [Mobilitalea sibirica]MBH1940270.1 30S ribosomal protein S20 [Mobilitalea sibirica]
MYKTKLCGFALTGLIGFIGLSPITAYAGDMSTKSITLSEKDQNNQDKKTAMKEKVQKAREKWNTLTDKQKDEVYLLMEKEMQSKLNLMDKLVKLGVMDKDEVDRLKVRMTEKFNHMKESGEFPFPRKSSHKNSR